MPVEITQEHIDQINRIARNVAHTPVGSKAGPDELESEALVVLWDMALRWDADRDVPFEAYISMHSRHRLIDWLRSEYGRGGRRTVALGTVSLDSATEDGLVPEFPSSAPSVEAVIESRERVTIAARTLQERCSERERDSILLETIEPYREKWEGASDATFYTHRTHAKTKVREALRAA